MTTAPTILAERVVSQVTHLLEERAKLATRMEEIDRILAPFVEQPRSRRRKVKSNGEARKRPAITEETRERMRAAWRRRRQRVPPQQVPPATVDTSGEVSE